MSPRRPRTPGTSCRRRCSTRWSTSIVIELLMYVVYVLAIRDADAVEANVAAPIEEIITQQVGSVVTKIVVAVALTNILACLLANILVATRLTYSMARDNMLPFSHVWRHVSADEPHADLRGARPLGCLSTVLLLSALVNEKAFILHPRLSRRWLFFFDLHPADHRPADRHTAEAPSRRPSPAPSTSAGARVAALPSPRWWCSSPGLRRPDLPAAVRQQQVGLPRAWSWSPRSGAATGLRSSGWPRRSRTGFRQDPPEPEFHCLPEGLLFMTTTDIGTSNLVAVEPGCHPRGHPTRLGDPVQRLRAGPVQPVRGWCGLDRRRVRPCRQTRGSPSSTPASGTPT